MKEEDDLVVLRWRSRTTGEEGHGDTAKRTTGEGWLECVRGKYPNIEHWLEPVKETKS